MTIASQHHTYRADIDGLRAIAVLSVILFHAFPGWLHGGFAGVDVFFVISGFLISGIILQELRQGNLRFSGFYARRIRRIFPALITVLTAVCAAGWFLLTPDEYEQLGKHIAAGAGFVGNFTLCGEAGYFDSAAELKPLLHLWSLAIEEQFYLVYPFMLWIVYRVKFNPLAAIVLLFLLSFGINIAQVTAHPETTFFYPHTRFWELWVGAILASINLFYREKARFYLNKLFPAGLLRLKRGGKCNSSILPFLAGVTGIALLLSSLLVIHRTSPFPGWWAFMPIAGTSLLILAGPQSWVNRNILSNKLMVFVGVISYPLYLWHWPLLAFARIFNNNNLPPRNIRIACVLAGFLLAWLTLRYIENPIRFGTRTRVKIISLSGAMALIACAGLCIYKQNGLEWRFDDKVAQFFQAAREREPINEMKRIQFHNIEYASIKSKRSGTTIFIGDSNAAQYYPRIDELIQKSADKTNSAIFKIGLGCFPVSGITYDSKRQHCYGLLEEGFKLVEGIPDVESVVLAAQWNGYFQEGFGLQKTIEYNSKDYENILNSISEYLASFVAMNKKVYLVLNIPIGEELDPKYMLQRDIKNFPDVIQVNSRKLHGIPRAKLDTAYGPIQADLERIARKAGAVVIKPMDFLCSRDTCPSLDANDRPIYRNNTHLRPSFVRSKASFIDQTVLGSLDR